MSSVRPGSKLAKLNAVFSKVNTMLLALPDLTDAQWLELLEMNKAIENDAVLVAGAELVGISKEQLDLGVGPTSVLAEISQFFNVTLLDVGNAGVRALGQTPEYKNKKQIKLPETPTIHLEIVRSQLPADQAKLSSLLFKLTQLSEVIAKSSYANAMLDYNVQTIFAAARDKKAGKEISEPVINEILQAADTVDEEVVDAPVKDMQPITVEDFYALKKLTRGIKTVGEVNASKLTHAMLLDQTEERLESYSAEISKEINRSNDELIVGNRHLLNWEGADNVVARLDREPQFKEAVEKNANLQCAIEKYKAVKDINTTLRQDKPVTESLKEAKAKIEIHTPTLARNRDSEFVYICKVLLTGITLGLAAAFGLWKTKGSKFAEQSKKEIEAVSVVKSSSGFFNKLRSMTTRSVPTVRPGSP